MERAVTKEKRWMVLGEDGRHVWLGRHSDPTPEEIRTSETRLREAGLGGWLAVHEGDYWGDQDVALMMVRPLASPGCRWDEAAERFEAARRNARASY